MSFKVHVRPAVGEELDISLPDGFEGAEEDPGDNEETELRFTEDGILIEPFNMRAEHFAGYFDNEENYVARVNKDDTDAWMLAMEGMCTASGHERA